MPAVEQLSRLTENKNPLGTPIPPDFEHHSKFHELSIRFSTIPLSWRLNSLLQTINADISTESPITVEEIINRSRQHEHSQMRWQSLRLDGESPTGRMPTGWEHMHIGKGWNDEDITAHISLLGLEMQKEHHEVMNQLLTGGFPSFSIEQLQDVDRIIEAKLVQEKQGMSSQALEFRADTLQRIKDLPKHLTTSYYYQGQRGDIVAIATVLERLPPHASYSRPIQWQSVYERILAPESSHDPMIQSAELTNITIQDLQRGRQIVELLSHGTGSFFRGFNDSIKSRKQ